MEQTRLEVTVERENETPYFPYLLPLKNCDKMFPMSQRKWFSATEEELRDLYEKRGMSAKEIAGELGYLEKTIRVYLVKYGITNNRQGGQVVWNIDQDTLRKLYHDEKKGIPEIAANLGCSETTVFKKLTEYGLRISVEEQGKRRTERNKVNFAHTRQSGGYTYIKKIGHHLANSNGYVSERRVNAETAMGRNLKPSERIHHINFNRRDNSPGNLAVLPSQGVHERLHKYMERCFAFMTGLSAVRPQPLDFGGEVFWGGRWITKIDLLPAAPLDFLGHEPYTEVAAPVAVN